MVVVLCAGQLVILYEGLVGCPVCRTGIPICPVCSNGGCLLYRTAGSPVCRTAGNPV